MTVSQECVVAEVFSLLGGRWVPHIIYALGIQGPMRFGELRRTLPGRASAKVMTESLKRLEVHGIVTREEVKSAIVEVTYSLTDKGQDLHGVMLSVEKVAAKWAQP